MDNGKNARLFNILDDLIEKGLFSNYKEFASSIGMTKQGISHLKNSVVKISIDTLESIKNLYPSISLDYIITGQGGYYISEESTSTSTPVAKTEEIPPTLLDLIHKISELSKTIGILEERNRQLEERNEELEKELDWMAKKAQAYADIASSAKNTSVG